MKIKRILAGVICAATAMLSLTGCGKQPDFFEAVSHAGDFDAYDYKMSISLDSDDIGLDLGVKGVIGDKGFDADLDISVDGVPGYDRISASTALAFDGDVLYLKASDIITAVEDIAGQELGIDFGSEWVSLPVEYTETISGGEYSEADIEKAKGQIEDIYKVFMEYAEKLSKEMKTSPLSNDGDWAVLTINNAIRADFAKAMQKLTQDGDTDKLIDKIVDIVKGYDEDAADDIKDEWADAKKAILEADTDKLDNEDIPEVEMTAKAKYSDKSFAFECVLKADGAKIAISFEKTKSDGNISIPKDSIDLEAWLNDSLGALMGGGYGDPYYDPENPWNDDWSWDEADFA